MAFRVTAHAVSRFIERFPGDHPEPGKALKALLETAFFLGRSPNDAEVWIGSGGLVAVCMPCEGGDRLVKTVLRRACGGRL